MDIESKQYNYIIKTHGTLKPTGCDAVSAPSPDIATSRQDPHLALEVIIMFTYAICSSKRFVSERELELLTAYKSLKKYPPEQM